MRSSVAKKMTLLGVVAVLGALLVVAGATRASGAATPQASDGAPVTDVEILKASRIIGMPVRNPAGASLGRIEELVLWRDNGDVAYAVLSHGGAFGFGSKYFAVPWTGLMLRAGESQLVLDIDSEQLQRAAGFEWQGEWPLRPDPMFRTDYTTGRYDDTRDDRPSRDRSDYGFASTIAVPAETRIAVELEDYLSSRDSRAGEPFALSVTEDVWVGGDIAIPRGTVIEGEVAAAEPAERPNKSGKLVLEAESIRLDGQEVPLRARITAEGEEIEGEGSVEDDLKEIGIGAAIGAVVGGIIKGGKGALAGLVIGGTGVFLATKGEQVELPAGTPLIVELRRPLEVPVASR